MGTLLVFFSSSLRKKERQTRGRKSSWTNVYSSLYAGYTRYINFFVAEHGYITVYHLI